jgi:beta-N-acetylhexosaminidase
VGRLIGFMAALIVIALALAMGLISLAPRPSTLSPDVLASSDFVLVQRSLTPVELLSPSAFAAAPQVASMSLEQRIRSLLIVSLAGTDATALATYVDSVGAGGFILMGKNIPSTPLELATETAALKGGAQMPRLIAIDEEGGEVTRLSYDSFAGANTLRNEPAQATQVAFTGRAHLLAQVGVNLNFGVIADVSADPKSFIYGRSFGSEPAQVAIRVGQAVRAEAAVNIASTLKHFPGHGSAAGDSHTSIPLSGLDLETWRTTDAIPFAAGISAGASAVMFGHLSFPTVDSTPASLSKTWHQILRRDLGFRGLAITDDMTMLQRSQLPELLNPVENAIRAFQAGNDMLVYTWGDAPASAGIDVDQLVRGVASAVQSGRISAQQINESALRVMALRAGLGSSATVFSQVCNVACLLSYSRLGILSAQG